MKKVMAILCFTMAGSAISADQPEKMTIEVSGAETPKQLSFWDKLKGFFSGKKESPKTSESGSENGSAGPNTTSGTNEKKSGSDDAMFSLEPAKTDTPGTSQERVEEGIPVFEGLTPQSGPEDSAEKKNEKKDNMKKKEDKKDKKDKKGKKKNKDEEE